MPSNIPSLNPSHNPTLLPTLEPSLLPTQPTDIDYSTNYTNTNGCDDIDGGDWILVRRVTASDNAWHPINDDLAGDTIYNTYSSDAQSDSTWSIIFDDMVPDYNQFLFATGNCEYWLVTEIEEATTKECNGCDRCVLNSSDVSSYNNLPYEVTWYNRGLFNEDPWISVQDHIGGASDTGDAEIVYGENSNTYHLTPMTSNNGGNVWIRNKINESRFCGMTHEPSPYPTIIPSLTPSNNPSIIPTINPSLYPTMNPTERGKSIFV